MCLLHPTVTARWCHSLSLCFFPHIYRDGESVGSWYISSSLSAFPDAMYPPTGYFCPQNIRVCAVLYSLESSPWFLLEKTNEELSELVVHLSHWMGGFGPKSQWFLVGWSCFQTWNPPELKWGKFSLSGGGLGRQGLVKGLIEQDVEQGGQGAFEWHTSGKTSQVWGFV